MYYYIKFIQQQQRTIDTAVSCNYDSVGEAESINKIPKLSTHPV